MKRVRPRFRIKAEATPDEIIKIIGDALRKPDCPISGVAAPGRVELHVHGKDQHLWSPQLIVELRTIKRGTALLGRFGPHPSVWTMYVAGYAACAFAMLVGVSFAYAEWVMEETPYSLLSVPASLVMALALYSLAFVGQGAGRKQMEQLKAYLIDLIDGSSGGGASLPAAQRAR
jgi:hypothetical protein